LTLAKPAPRIFGGARKIRSSLLGGDEQRAQHPVGGGATSLGLGVQRGAHRLIFESVTSTNGISANHGRILVLSRIR